MTNDNFVDRYDELSIVRYLLDNLSAKKPIQFPLREYTGIGGVGKTALLKQICGECSLRNIPHFFMDYSDFVSLSAINSAMNPIRAIMAQIASETLDTQLPHQITPIQSFLESLVGSSEVPLEILGTKDLQFDNPHLSAKEFPEQDQVQNFLNLFDNFYGLLAFDSLNLTPPEVLDFLVLQRDFTRVE